jgi:DNA processing protein
VHDIGYLVGLNKLRDIGPVRFFKLFKKYKSIEKVFAFTVEDLLELRLGQEKAVGLARQRDALVLDKELAKIQDGQVEIITFFSKDYPEQLKQIYAPPYILYAKGNTDLLNKKDWLAIVGTRRATPYGLKMTEVMARELAYNSWGIVSGMAKGIDTKAHEAVLQTEGETIAVLGCGINVIYPYENKRLYKEIENKGLILSEVPLDTEPLPFQFPLRNRIITGLSKGTIVIEGSFKSGAMISGKLALEQDREVFALPGRVTDKYSEGPNWLIKQGAKLINNTEDILEEFGAKASNCQNMNTKKPLVRNYRLTEKENNIVKFLDDDGVNIETLSDDTGLNIAELMLILSELELKGVIKQLPGKQFIQN